MRLSSVFDSKLTGRSSQAPERAAAPAAGPAEAVATLPPDVPDDLDQRVRQIGEWQLEDW
jgi:hypothetical protein